MNNTENDSATQIVMGRITYINMDPVYYGLKNGRHPQWIEMVDDVPAVLNGMLASEALDISPVSAVAYARNADQWLVLPDLKIASHGKDERPSGQQMSPCRIRSSESDFDR